MHTVVAPEHRTRGVGIPRRLTVIVRVSDECNLQCSYCYAGMHGRLARGSFLSEAMACQIVEAFLSLDVDRVDFNWHGGEPFLGSPEVVRAAIRVQRRLQEERGVVATNKLQTNATKFPAGWRELVREHPIDVGISLDGPPVLHDRHRRAGDAGSFTSVMETVRELRALSIPFGTLVVVTEDAARCADLLVDFLAAEGLSVDLLPCFVVDGDGAVAPPSVSPRAWGDFLVRVFDRWIELPNPFPCRILEDALGSALGYPPATCAFRGSCHGFYSVDTTGTLYACDLFLGREDMALGQLGQVPLTNLLNSERARAIRNRMSGLPVACRACAHLAACGGGCTAHRSRVGHYYFCISRKRLFSHIQDYLQAHPGLAADARLARSRT